MKANRFLFLNLLFISTISYCQKYPTNVTSYYEKLYKAESFIIDNKFDSASFYFNRLIKIYDHKTNSIDIYNCLLLNLINNNKTQTNNCFKLLSKKNVSISKLIKVKQIDSLLQINPTLITKKVVKSFDKKYKENATFLLKLYHAYTIDQNVRKNDAYKTVEGQKAIYKVDSISYYLLKDYLLKFGFNDYEAMLHNDTSSLSILEAMLIHQASWHRSEFIDLIQIGLKNLEIKPGIANYIIDVITGNNEQHETVALFKIEYDDSACSNKYKNKWLLYQYSPTILNKINSARKKDLLEDWDFYLKKCTYLTQNSLFKWHNSFSTSIMNFSSCDELQSYINHAKDNLKIVN